MEKKTAEDKIYEFIIDNGYPAPERQYRAIPGRKFQADFAWPQYGLILEVEGGAFTGGRHTRGAGFVKDIEKYNLYAYHEWYLFRVIPSHIRAKKGGESFLRKTLRQMFGY